MAISITALQNEQESFVEEKSGLSLYVEADGKRILFDTSINDEAKRNAQKLGIDLSLLDFIVLSHGHWDHVQGLSSLEGTAAKVIAHPACFEKKYYAGESIGIDYSLEDARKKFSVILSEKPYPISANVTFLGEIPRLNDFEAKEPVGNLENREGDYLRDDSALAIKSPRGVVLVAGCSHAGICNTISYAKEVCGQKVFAVIGGFHLFNRAVTDRTVQFMQEQGVKLIFPAHCLDEYAFNSFEDIGAERIRTFNNIRL